MNIQTHIRDSLWLAVQSTYESGNYSHAILDSMHYLSTILREKTGSDGDGVALVGQALGGDSPRLRINKFQTETERNEQKGIENILRGMYQAIRNPRSHEQIEDSQETANAIIYFVDYLLGLIQKSEEPFVLSRFLHRVFDPDFYKTTRYAELLVEEIPPNKRFDTLITVYREKMSGDIYIIGLVVKSLINKLSDDQTKRFIAIVSDELSTVKDEAEIRYNIYLMPPSLWEQLSEAPRLRIENRIIRAIKEGEIENGKAKKGALAIWSREHFAYFTLKDQVALALVEKLESRYSSVYFYVIQLFFYQLPSVILTPTNVERCVKAIANSIRNGDFTSRDILLQAIESLPKNWQREFIESLKDITDENNPALYLSDGTPFLRADTGEEELDF